MKGKKRGGEGEGGEMGQSRSQKPTGLCGRVRWEEGRGDGWRNEGKMTHGDRNIIRLLKDKKRKKGSI